MNAVAPAAPAVTAVTAVTAVPVLAGGAAGHKTLAAFVASIRHLPLFPPLAQRLIDSVRREDISATDLARLIAADVALSSHLLRLVNSSFYGLSRRIGAITDAIAVLGFNMVRRIVTTAVLQRPVQDLLPDTPATRAFWRHQLLTAALARHLHRRDHDSDEELAYMAGLLHDIGCLALFAHAPAAYVELLGRSGGSDDALADAERQHFGYDHAQVGATLLRLWNVPETITATIQDHADGVAPVEPVACSVWRANGLAQRVVAVPAPDPADAELLAAGLDAATLRRILDEVASFESGAR